MWIESQALAFVTVETADQFFRQIVFWLAGVLAVSLAIRWLISRPWAEPQADAKEPLDAYDAAYIAGGYRRLADAVMAAMYRAGQVELKKPRTLRLVGRRSDELSVFVKTVLDIAAASGTVDDARRAVKFVASGQCLKHLVERGLVLPTKTQRRARLLSALPCVVLLLMLLGRLYVGWDRGEDVQGVFWISLLVTVATLWFATNAPRVTGLGRAELRRLKAKHRHSASVRGQSAADWAWMCGLFGVMALPATEAEKLQAGLRPGSGGSSDGDADAGESGCSGCSGCGGCGGCGD